MVNDCCLALLNKRQKKKQQHDDIYTICNKVCNNHYINAEGDVFHSHPSCYAEHPFIYSYYYCEEYNYSTV